MNEQLIDTVISPGVDAQVTSLTKLLQDLDIVMIADIKSANALNTALSNSKSFADYNKTATAAGIQLEKLQQQQNKTAQTTVTLNAAQAKAAADQQARDDKAAAALISKQSRQATADAKEIASAEAKAAKLSAMQDAANAKAAESAARRANTQFPNVQTAPNPVTGEPDNPSTRYEPIITGNENMAITATKSTAAIAAENVALLEQQEVLGGLTIAQRSNIEAQLALQAEMTANRAEIKALNAEDAASAERLAFLTAEQLRLKIAMSEVTIELNKQTKEQLSQEGSVKQLTAALEILRNEYFELGVAERESASGQAMLININKLDLEVKRLRMSVGDTSKEVGAYEKAIAKATSGTQLATQAITIATRTIVRMVAQFALFGIIFKAAEALYDYIRALDMFNPVATEAEMRQKSLVDAFNSSDYTKGIESLEKLSANLELIKKGIGNSDNVINEYNATIGKTFGYVNNLTDAQKGFIDNSDAYIKAIYLEAAAQSILADSAKEIGTAMAKNQADRNEIEKLNAGGGTVIGINLPNKKQNANDRLYTKDAVDNLQADINKRDKRIKEIIENSKKALQNTYKDLNAVPGQGGATVGSDPAAELANKIANAALEHQKIIEQAKISNEKLSYKTRLDAINAFYSASEQIEKNNEALQLKELPAKDARREDVEKEATNKLLQLQESRNAQLASLRDKQYKQDQEILKNNIQKQLDLFKQISEDTMQSYDMKLIALDEYGKRSKELIEANYKQQLKEAGKNGESINLAEQEKAKAILQLDNQTASDRLKIQKENLQKILEQTKESEQEQLETLQNGSNLALRALTEVKDKKVNALNLERAQGKIEEKKYNQELLEINDQFAIDRIAQEIATQQGILAAREGYRDATLSRMKIDGASPVDIAKFTSGANKDIQGTKNTLANLGDDLINAKSKQAVDKTKNPTKEAEEERKKIEEAATKATIEAIDSIDKLRQKAYEAEIQRLEKLKDQIDENAANEKLQVQNSIASSATKARELAVIEAQASAQKKAIDAQEKKEKQKSAIADKEATIAKIIIEGALAVVKALPNLILAGIVAAGVAVELATAVATPIPKYALGTDNYPGGLGIWGEAGMERADLPDGTVHYSHGASLANFPRGTKITPHLELMQQIRPANVGYVGGESIGWVEVVKQLKKMEPKAGRTRVNVNVDMGYENYKQQYLRR